MSSKKYTKLRILLQGDFGSVTYLAKDNQTEKEYFLKQIGNSTEEEIKKAENESKIISNFDCPNIIKLIEFFKESQLVFLVMEYCQDGSLESLITNYKSKDKYLREYEVIDLTVQIMNGLSYIHSKNIIHRDIHPGNIYVKNDEIKIGSLGLAKSSDNSSQTMTVSKYISYVCPEYIKKKEYVLNSDIWSAACVIYELITLEKAFPQENLRDILKAITEAKIPEVKSYILSSILNRMFQENPEQRLKSEELLNIFKEILKLKSESEKKIIEQVFSVDDDVLQHKLNKGQYRIIKNLGSSACLIEDLKNSRQKLVMKTASNKTSTEDIKKLTNEAEKLRLLKSKGTENSYYIINIVDSFNELGQFCIITEYFEDGDLSKTIAQNIINNKKFDFESVRIHTIQIMSGLDFLHQNEIVHKNLKPSNLFWYRNQLKIGHFSTASINQSWSRPFFKADFNLYYTCPELYNDLNELSSKIDIWSAGCIIYEMITLKKAFDGKTIMQVYNLIKDTEPSINDDIFGEKNKQKSEKLIEILKMTLQKNPNNRPTAKEIKNKLNIVTDQGL